MIEVSCSMRAANRSVCTFKTEKAERESRRRHPPRPEKTREVKSRDGERDNERAAPGDPVAGRSRDEEGGRGHSHIAHLPRGESALGLPGHGDSSSELLPRGGTELAGTPSEQLLSSRALSSSCRLPVEEQVQS